MRISDWSSDVCSSDLSLRPSTSKVKAQCAVNARPACEQGARPQARQGLVSPEIMISQRHAEAADRTVPGHWEGGLILGFGSSAIGTQEIGRASWRERVCQYV